jgi:general secretion pathway protein I
MIQTTDQFPQSESQMHCKTQNAKCKMQNADKLSVALPNLHFASPLRPTGRRRRSGFTLVEVLAAMVMIAIVLPVIMRGITLATSAASYSRHRTAAAALASLKLNELVATGAWQSGGLSGDFSTEFPGYQWSATVGDWTESDLRQLDVHVTWGAGQSDQSVTLTTLIYPNAPTGAAAPAPQPAGAKRGPGQTSTSGGLR